MQGSAEEYRQRFTAFYDSLVEVHPQQFASGGPQRIGSTFRVPGAGGLDAQTFYMRHVLDMLFDDPQLIEDLVTLCRSAYRGVTPPAEAVARIAATDGVHQVLFTATEAASGLTARIGRWSAGTDLFANILTNTDCALQMAGLYDHAKTRKARGAKAAEGTMDQSAIDALFG
ncbi:hypothetical protein ACM64Y_06190 [Novispirillum sp. DQ9]|uniref:hypothetical protein n=1 Tax=Novispirillum sp. DQ9 TaxID=3398612 RepID=UPI003C7E56E0